MNACSRLRQSLVWAAGSAALLTVGCDDPLKRVELIQEMRVLGARVEVQGEPQRGSPQPGELASVRFFVAGPDGPPELSYALSLCAVSPTNSGLPACSGPAFATVQQAQPSAQSPTLEFQVPSDLNVPATPHGFVTGQISGTEVAFEFELGSALNSNANPSFASDSLSLDGDPWPAAAGASCADLPVIPADSRHELGLQLADQNFEALAQATSLDPARETLLVSEFTSAGSLDHAFTSLSPGRAEQGSAVWRAPAKVDQNGTVVRFYFVVRDLRGGEDFTTRALCVLP